MTPGEPMAKPKPEKKPAAAAPAPTRVLPMELQVGDRLVNERAEWKVIGRPYSSAGGKMVHARVQYIRQPATVVVWVWGAHEKVSVRRA